MLRCAREVGVRQVGVDAGCLARVRSNFCMRFRACPCVFLIRYGVVVVGNVWSGGGWGWYAHALACACSCVVCLSNGARRASCVFRPAEYVGKVLFVFYGDGRTSAARIVAYDASSRTVEVGRWARLRVWILGFAPFLIFNPKLRTLHPKPYSHT